MIRQCMHLRCVMQAQAQADTPHACNMGWSSRVAELADSSNVELDRLDFQLVLSKEEHDSEVLCAKLATIRTHGELLQEKQSNLTQSLRDCELMQLTKEEQTG